MVYTFNFSIGETEAGLSLSSEKHCLERKKKQLKNNIMKTENLPPKLKKY